MPIHISWSSRRFESSQADHIYKDTGKYRLIKHKYPSKSCPRDLDSSQLQRFKTSLSSKHFLSTARIAEPGHGDQPKKNMSTVSICTHTDNAWIIHICNIYMYLYVCISNRLVLWLSCSYHFFQELVCVSSLVLGCSMPTFYYLLRFSAVTGWSTNGDPGNFHGFL